jgi:hypothetical protein
LWDGKESKGGPTESILSGLLDNNDEEGGGPESLNGEDGSSTEELFGMLLLIGEDGAPELLLWFLSMLSSWMDALSFLFIFFAFLFLLS